MPAFQRRYPSQAIAGRFSGLYSAPNAQAEGVNACHALQNKAYRAEKERRLTLRDGFHQAGISAVVAWQIGNHLAIGCGSDHLDQ